MRPVLVACISDVHANAHALAAVLEVIDGIRPDHVFTLGDLVGRGPDPQRVMDMLAERGLAPTVRGNWDEWVAGATGAADRPGRYTWVLAARAMMKPASVAALLAAPETRALELGGRRLFLAHGSPRDPVERLLSETSDEELARACAPAARSDVIAVGHSHHGFVRWLGETAVINCGSVGYAVAGDPRACFALLDLSATPRFELIRVPYRFRKNARSMWRAARRGLVPEESAHHYLRNMLGRGPEPREPLRRDEFGAALGVKLLAQRASHVYREGSARSPPEDEIEHFHALRVATRRLREALALIEPCLPARSKERCRRRLRNLGRALGVRRAADVLIEHALRAKQDVSDAGKEKEAQVLHAVVALGEARRLAATVDLEARFGPERLIRHGVAVIALAMRTRSRSEPRSLAAIAAAHLAGRVREVREVLGTIALPDDEPGHHELRIRLKRLRYAVELLAPAFEELGGAEVVDLLRDVQDELGELHDLRELRLALLEAATHAQLDPAALTEVTARTVALEQRTYANVRDQVLRGCAPLLDRLAAAAEKMDPIRAAARSG